MYKSSVEIDKRIAGNVENVKIVGSEKGNTKGSGHLTKAEKIIAGTVARIDSVNAAAELLDIAPTTARRAARGLTGDGFNKDQELTDAVNSAVGNQKEDVIAKATAAMVQALGIVETRLPFTNKALDASAVAKNMSSIINDMQDKSTNGGTNIQIIIEGSKPRDLKEYEVIDV
jgi:hypothetical protein